MSGSAVVLVTGADGQLGRAMLEAGNYREGVDIVECSHDRLDVTDMWEVARLFRLHRPAFVVNCAAWTDVDGAEDDPARATMVNAIGAVNVARVALDAGVRMVQVSTDYVFDGRDRPYTPADTPWPLGVYGASKLAGEHLVLATLEKMAVVVRTSWVYGHGGSPSFPEKALEWAKRKDRHDEPKVVRMDDSQRSVPTFASDLAGALLDLLSDEGWEPWAGRTIHVVGGGGSATRFEWAREVYREATWMTVTLEAAAPGEYREMERARRPSSSVLASDIQLPDWRASTRRFVDELRRFR